MCSKAWETIGPTFKSIYVMIVAAFDPLSQQWIFEVDELLSEYIDGDMALVMQGLQFAISIQSST